MSAIIGIYNYKNEPVLNDINKLLKSLEGYPSDDFRTWHNKNISFGNLAQWITAESIRERLPYYDYTRQLAITSDAIIDNRKELFDKLQVKKEFRKTMPDSQLIVLAYQKWGENVPKYLIGDFAFVIWDEKEQKIFAARDFSGSRTLYFYHDHNHFAFSTLIEPLFTLPYIEKKLNKEWLAEFLAIPNMVESVDMLLTPYKMINQLPPSHSLTVKGGKVTISRYCTIEIQSKLKLKSNEEYVEAFREVLQRAVTDRLRTNGNVGSHLSGGLDSGSVVSLAARELRKEKKILHTFSAVPQKSYIDWTQKELVADESPFIKSTVEYVGNITDHYLGFDERDPISEIDVWLEIMEMPYKFFENAYWMRGFYEEATNLGIKVLLNGARGNWTISWGSAMFYYASLLKRLRLIQLNRELTLYTQQLKLGKTNVLPTIRSYAFPKISDMFRRHEPSNVLSLISPKLAETTGVYQKLEEFGIDIYGTSIKSDNELRTNHFKQIYTWNKSGTLGTKLSLRHSLWERDPTNDIRVIQFCLQVPDSQYVQNGFDRSLIRRSMKGYLPDKVRLNQQVRGIQGADVINRMAPYWDSLINEVKDICNQPDISELLNIDIINEAIETLGPIPRPEYLLSPYFRILSRTLIVYRFLKKNFI
jgi:asparagine synthase (glutamine-hydrolysing)